MKNEKLLKIVLRKWHKQIFIGVFFIFVFITFFISDIKNSHIFIYYMSNYTEYYNVERNYLINNIHSILDFYKKGSVQSINNIDGLSYKIKNKQVVITIINNNENTKMIIDSIKNIKKEINGNKIYINLDYLKELNKDIKYYNCRSILEKFFNYNFINIHKELQIFDRSNLDVNSIKNKIKNLGEAEIKKIESKTKIDNSHENEMRNQEVTIKDENTTFNFEEEVKKIEDERLQKELEQKEIKEKNERTKRENEKNGTLNLKSENYGDSDFAKEVIKANKENLTVPENVKNNQMKNRFDRFKDTEVKQQDKPKKTAKDLFKELDNEK